MDIFIKAKHAKFTNLENNAIFSPIRKWTFFCYQYLRQSFLNYKRLNGEILIKIWTFSQK